VKLDEINQEQTAGEFEPNGEIVIHSIPSKTEAGHYFQMMKE